MSKKIVFIFNHFETEHLGKDVFLLPYYLGKRLSLDVNIVYPKTKTNSNFPSTHNNVTFVPLEYKKSIFSLVRTFNFYKYLVSISKSTDIFIRFHLTLHTMLMVILYKVLNTSGLAYVKLDINPNQIKPLKGLKKILYPLFIHFVDVISCETSYTYSLLGDLYGKNSLFFKKLEYLPNGFDEELLRSLNLEEYDFESKENLFINVCRIGSEPKNTQMILSALEKIDLFDWKFYFIGPIEDGFKMYIDDFFKRNPFMVDKVIFTGPIYDKGELWRYYNRSKVFVMTSRWESYGLVFNEAKRFKNYLLSTRVGAFDDLCEKGKYGLYIEQDDDETLSKIMTEIILGNVDIDVYKDYDTDSLSWETIVNSLKLPF